MVGLSLNPVDTCAGFRASRATERVNGSEVIFSVVWRLAFFFIFSSTANWEGLRALAEPDLVSSEDFSSVFFFCWDLVFPGEFVSGSWVFSGSVATAGDLGSNSGTSWPSKMVPVCV